MSATQTSFTPEAPNTLLESGAIALAQVCAAFVMVRRGMTMRTREGTVAGHVAALMFDGRSEKVTHLVLSCPRQGMEYRLIPISLIDAVDDCEIRLNFFQPILEELPIWHIS